MLRIGAELRCNPKVTHFDLMNGTRERGGSEAPGLVDRLPDDRDRRVKQLVQTAKGRRARRCLTRRVLATGHALVPLDGSGREQLLEWLRQLGGEGHHAR